MVSMREVNRERIQELTDGFVILLLRWLGNSNKKKVSLNRREVLRYFYESLKQAEFTDEQIVEMLNVDKAQLKRIRRGKRFSKGLVNALELFGNPIAVLKKSDDYAYTYTISRNTVETVIIQKLIMGGWTTRQVSFATGYGIRRIQRIAKKLREALDEQD